MYVLDPNQSCLPQAMWLVYKAVQESPGLDFDGIIGLVVPEAMRERTPGKGAHARGALDGLVEFGLVVDSDGLNVAIGANSVEDFLRHLRRRLVVPPDLVDSDFVGAPDLRSALIWLMRQSPLVPLHYKSNVQQAMPSGLFTNDTRWNGFRWWSQALGFGRSALPQLLRPNDQRASIVPDPTDAVVDAIRNPFGDSLPRGEGIPVGRFLDFLRSELPVLPGHPSATYPGLTDREDHGVRVLGLALSSAEQRQVLSMAYQSDPSGVMALPDAQDFGRTRYISTVTIKG